MEDHIRESASFIRSHAPCAPAIGVILGSGLGEFIDAIPGRKEIKTRDVPHYPRSTVAGHKGKLVFTSLGGKEILAFQGRIHFYECNSLETVLYPIKVAQQLGIRTLVVTNAAGGINRTFSPGDLMIITDHINLTGLTPAGSLSAADRHKMTYDNELIQKALSAAEQSQISVRSGVYVGLLGPSYETAAEIEMLNRLGGDAVGMSTVLEVSLGASLGMEILGISCITNLATGIGLNKLSHSEVTEVGNRVRATFAGLLASTIALI